MSVDPSPVIENHLAVLREKRGLSAARLAGLAGVSRQTIYAIEASTYVPNTAVALRLAQALEVKVEDLFALAGELPVPELRSTQTTLLPGSEALEPGQPVQLCRVGQPLIATPPSPVSWYFPASDAVIAGKPSATGKTNVQIFNAESDFANRILVAGCDPAISVLARHVQSAGVELVLAHRNSSQALGLLKKGLAHIAGVHLRDESSGESNIPEISRLFPKNSVVLIAFAIWEEGIVTAAGNPKGLRGVEDFARKDVTIVNREAGAGSRRLLDEQLKKLGVPATGVRGYAATAPGHLPAAWQVKTGAADCCIATRAAARVLGLGFIPLLRERYDFAVRRTQLDLPGIQALLDVLTRTRFRRELEALGGYDAGPSGQRML